MALTTDQRKRFRTIGHGLHPLVTIADKGLSEGVREELERALGDHELIKIKLQVDDRRARQELVATICSEHGATLVQSIGKVALLYRANPDADPRKSNIARNPVS